MAIDSEPKRRSAVGTWGITRVLPVPDGAIGAGDRAHLHVYNLQGGDALGEGGKVVWLRRRRKGRR